MKRDATWERTPQPNKIIGKAIVCAQCGTSGGTLVKTSQGIYAHKDTALCKVMKLRRKLV